MVRDLISVAALAKALFAGSASAQTPYLRIATIPDQDQARLVGRCSRFANYLERKLGTNVVFAHVPSYSAAVWRLHSRPGAAAIPGRETMVQDVGRTVPILIETLSVSM
jgi:ABC-type phosphate/phosphonate transport system substrate-binding protein